MGLLPFGPAGHPGASAEYYPLLAGVHWTQFYPWWYRVKTWLLEITITFDPATVAPGNPSVHTYAMALSRQVSPYEAEGERAMIRPGVGNPISPGACRFTGALALPSGDAYFSAIEWNAALAICDTEAPTGYTATGDAGKPATRYSIDLEHFLPSVTLNIGAVFSDGAEGLLGIQLHDPFAAASPPTEDVIGMEGEMDGIPFAGYAINFGPTYADGGVAPVVTLTPAEWYEFRRSDGSEPIYDASTGAILPGMTPFTQQL